MQSCPAKARKKAAGPAKDRQPQCNRASHPTPSLAPDQTNSSPRGCSALGEPITPLEHALTYADLGLRVIPCSGNNPFMREWPRRASTASWQIHHWWSRDERYEDDWFYRILGDYMAGGKCPGANVGIVTGRGLAVIDVDLRHGGFETLAALEAELGRLPRDWVVRTGGGGLHIYLTVPKNVGRLRDLGPGVEVKYHNQCVTAPPSVHESGEKYRWENCTGDKPPRMPKSWLEKAKKRTFVATSNEAKCSNSNDLHSKTTTEPDTHTQCGGKAGLVLRTNLVPSDPDNAPFDAPLQAAKGSKDFPKRIQQRINAAVLRCTVIQPGTRNLKIMELARSLRRIPGLADRPYWDFLPALWCWYDGSKDCMDASWKAVQTHWKYLWGKWVKGRGWQDSQDTALMAYRAITASPMPSAIAARYPGNGTLQRLMALCAEMERRKGVEPWFLSERKAADLLGVTRKVARRGLQRLIADGIIEPVGEHKRGSARAQRYRYVAERRRVSVEVSQREMVTAV